MLLAEALVICTWWNFCHIILLNALFGLLFVLASFLCHRCIWLVITATLLLVLLMLLLHCVVDLLLFWLLLTVPRSFKIQSAVFVAILWIFRLFTFSANIRFTSSKLRLFAVVCDIWFVCVIVWVFTNYWGTARAGPGAGELAQSASWLDRIKGC